MNYYINPKIKNYKVDTRIRDLEEQMTKDGLQFRRNCFSTENINELLAMAIEGVVPNGHYSDSECCLWEAMRRVLRGEAKGNVITWDDKKLV